MDTDVKHRDTNKQVPVEMMKREGEDPGLFRLYKGWLKGILAMCVPVMESNKD